MRRLFCLLLLPVLAACSSAPPAPVVDRSTVAQGSTLEKDGRYRVRDGDTLYAIAFDHGLDHRDLARWNAIKPPYVIFPEQLLRMDAPPVQASAARKSAPQAKPSKAPVRPVQNTKPAGSGSTGGVAVKPLPGAAEPQNKQSGSTADPASWIWPVKGRLLRGFLAGNPSRNGLDIAGREGQAIVATAPGTVVYSGNGLIGFGELIIIKHSERMLSAYAHNRVRMVAEGALVKAGDQIAELGRNDRNEAILHFEIRVNGRPVDPRQYLPVQ